MRGRLPFFIYLFFTAVILIYAAARLAIDDAPIQKIRILSDAPGVRANMRSLLMQTRPQDIPSELPARFQDIEHVSVKNNRDGTIDVRIKHKKIVGIWESGGIFYPLLENGSHINAPYGSRPAGALAFRGNVPPNVAGIAEIISNDKIIAQKTDYLEYVDGRRWNIRLAGGSTIMLPEQNVSGALAKIKTLGLLNKSFDILDLRDDRRALVMPRRQ